MISDWVGYWFFVSYTAGPGLDADEPAKPVRGKLEAVTDSFLLEHFGEPGIEVKRNPTDPTIFVSWCSTCRGRRRRCGSRSTSETLNRPGKTASNWYVH